jgi:hypothetical protein
MITPSVERELRTWSRRNALVREVYYLEQILAEQKTGNLTKNPCLVDGCTTMTAAKSGVCPPHQKTAKYL